MSEIDSLNGGPEISHEITGLGTANTVVQGSDSQPTNAETL